MPAENERKTDHTEEDSQNIEHNPLDIFQSRRRHTRYWRDWSSDVCYSDLFMGRARIPTAMTSIVDTTCCCRMGPHARVPCRGLAQRHRILEAHRILDARGRINTSMIFAGTYPVNSSRVTSLRRGRP